MRQSIHLACQYFLNHDLRESELRDQVRMLARSGFECIYAHARQGLITPYFSRKWWDAVGVVLETCRECGIQFAIWDEDCYPSGVAGDRVFRDHPDCGAQRLEFTIFEAERGERVYRIFEWPATVYRCFAVDREGGTVADITEYCGSIKRDCVRRDLRHIAYSFENKIMMPHWRAVWGERRFALDWEAPNRCRIVAAQICRTPTGAHTTDLMKTEATRRFLECTHEEYFRRYGEAMFDELFDASFMDEPSVDGRFPWTDDFEAEFFSDHRFELAPNLAHLVTDIDERSYFIRHSYRMTQHRLLCTRYLGQVGEWCRAHRIKSIGHLSRTEYLSVCNSFLWPNELRCCKHLDIPCTDPLGAGIAWPDACAYHTGLKVVSSAAHLFQKEQAGSDALAVLGNEVSLRDLQFHLDYQLVLGITYFNIHGLSYSIDGPRKDEVPPPLFYQHTEWPWMVELWKRTGELCRILSSGRHLCRIAVLYTSAGFYCRAEPGENNGLESTIHRLAENLLSHQKDFDFIDEITLRELFEADAAEFTRRYPYFLLPEVEFMERITAECLERYAERGGRLLLAGAAPQLIGSRLDASLFAWEKAAAYRCPDYLGQLPGPRLTGEGRENIFIQQREIGGETVSFLFNRAEREFSGELDGVPVWIPPQSGQLNSATSPRENTVPAAEIREWSLAFPENHVPLIRWSGWESDGREFEFNLLNREAPETEEELTVESVFLYSGDRLPLRLVVEESSFTGNWRCWVNQTEITEFLPSAEYDCRNRSADITAALRTGSTPTLNRVRFTGNGPLEMPYLYGNFKTAFRHASKTLPYLTGFDGRTQTGDLQPWSEFGFGAYSGRAEYTARLCVPEEGTYRLDLGRVEDLAEIFLDQERLGVLFAPPYVTDKVFLKRGGHELRIVVCNGPGNRDRLADLSSGLLGPVTLLQSNG